MAYSVRLHDGREVSRPHYTAPDIVRREIEAAAQTAAQFNRPLACSVWRRVGHLAVYVAAFDRERGWSQ